MLPRGLDANLVQGVKLQRFRAARRVSVLESGDSALRVQGTLNPEEY